MPLIEIETFIHSPVERVFDLARSIDAHMVTTEGTGERAVAGRTSGLIELGETVTWEATHFGLPQQLTGIITELERPWRFTDKMLTGAFAQMSHTHEFTPHEGGTLMRDRFEFTAPFGVAGWLAERLFLTRYMERFLTQRAEALQRLAQSDQWRAYLPEARA